MASTPPWQLLLFIPVIAFFYASVGFGGASGYLAAMSLFALSPDLMASTALTLNILVSAIAFTAYFRARHFIPRLLWPFLLTSIPAAFVGGSLPLPENTYLILLYLSLSYIAFRMLLSNLSLEKQSVKQSPFYLVTALLAGAIIGLLSGMIGIGGGIFLAPLIILAGWGTPKQAAASAAGFIFINSLSGLAGRYFGDNLELGPLGLWLLPLGLTGALAGSTLGARYLSAAVLRRLLGVILLLAVGRFWLNFIG